MADTLIEEQSSGYPKRFRQWLGPSSIGKSFFATISRAAWPPTSCTRDELHDETLFPRSRTARAVLQD
jgi:hypothetical protein